MGKDKSCSESHLKCFKGGTASLEKFHVVPLAGKTHEQNSDFRICVNEMIEVGEMRKD